MTAPSGSRQSPCSLLRNCTGVTSAGESAGSTDHAWPGWLELQVANTKTCRPSPDWMQVSICMFRIWLPSMAQSCPLPYAHCSAITRLGVVFFVMPKHAAGNCRFTKRPSGPRFHCWASRVAPKHGNVCAGRSS